MCSRPRISYPRTLRAIVWASQSWLLLLTAHSALADRNNDSVDYVSVATVSVNHRGGLSLLQRNTHHGSHPGLGEGPASLVHNGSVAAKWPPTPKRVKFSSLLAANVTRIHSASNSTGMPIAALFDTTTDAGTWHGMWLSPAFLLMNLRSRVSEAISSVVTGTTSTHQLPNNFYGGQSRIGGLLLELHLPALSLEEIHHGSYKSLADFLLQLREALSSTAGVKLQHISILGIHERFQLQSTPTTAQLQTEPSNLVPQSVGTVTGRELLVRFAVTSRNASDLDPQSAVDTLRSAIRDRSSKLMSGPLGSALQNSTITLSLSSDLTVTPVAQQKETATQISAMALPIGISAAFTGILVWLAAF